MSSQCPHGWRYRNRRYFSDTVIWCVLRRGHLGSHCSPPITWRTGAPEDEVRPDPVRVIEPKRDA